MNDYIKQVRGDVVDALTGIITTYDSFPPVDAPDFFGVVTQMTQTPSIDSSCGDSIDVVVDLDLYADYKLRGGNSTLDDYADSVIVAIYAITGYLNIRMNSTATNAVVLLNRTNYRRNINFTVTV